MAASTDLASWILKVLDNDSQPKLRDSIGDHVAALNKCASAFLRIEWNLIFPNKFKLQKAISVPLLESMSNTIINLMLEKNLWFQGFGSLFWPFYLSFLDGK